MFNSATSDQEKISKILFELKNKYVATTFRKLQPSQHEAFSSSCCLLLTVLLFFNRNEDSRDSAAIALGKYVQAYSFVLMYALTNLLSLILQLNFQARNQSAEIYARIINDLTNQIFELVNNNAPHVQMGGVLAIGLSFCLFFFFFATDDVLCGILF